MFLPLMEGAPRDARPQPSAAVGALAEAAAGRTYLPLAVTKGIQLTTENYPVGYWTASSIKVFGGRVTVTIPKQAIPYSTCTLTIVTPDAQAAWLEAYVYIVCSAGTLAPPVYVTELYAPITITLDYAKVDLAYLDETRLTLLDSPSTNWVPEVGGWRPMPAESAESADTGATIWQTRVDTTAKRMVLTTNRTFVVPRIAVGYAISDMATGPGGVYAAAAPIIYRVGANGSLTRQVNLDEVPGASTLSTSFTRFTVNESSGEFYLPLRSKVAGTPLKVFGLSGTALRALYTVPAGEELWTLAYRSQDNVVYLGMSKVVSYFFGCPVRDNWVRAIRVSDGAVVGSIGLGGAYIKPIAAMTVNSANRLLLVQPMTGCDSSGYSGSHLVTAGGASVLSALNQSYPGFRGANYVASDDQGRTILSNGTGDALSVVSGATSELLGYIPVSRPGPLAVSGSMLYVVSNGRLIQLSTTGLSTGGYTAKILESTLSGKESVLHVTGSGFAAVPAHNVLHFNGVRAFMSGESEYSFTGQEAELSYPIQVLQPQPVVYKPLSQQSGLATFHINGLQVASQRIAVPETPFLEWQYGDYTTGPNIAIAQGRWALLTFQGSLSSQEGLFAAISDSGSGVHRVFIQFSQPGVFHFLNQEEGQAARVFTATVDPYGAFSGETITVDPAVGGVLWVGGAALEIPAGALPSQDGGYQVTFASKTNWFTLHDTVSSRSPIYTFSFTPEVLHLSKSVLLHLPRAVSGDDPVMAFYDPLLNDPYAIPAADDPTAAHYRLVTLAAGDYPSSATGELQAAAVEETPAVEANWLRRGLNWLGTTGIWHAVGLPNDKLETTHFVILFNSNDCTPAYAATLLDALEEGYTTFSQQGATMPGEVVYVKVAPWIATHSAPGMTPGIGSLFHFYMFINNSLSTEALQDTAVHEFMHVLQKTNATPDGRYMNPTWWEEATATWAQYSVYPAHTTYYTDIQGEGERWLRRPYSQWNYLSSAEMYAAMALAEYLTQQYGMNAVFGTFHQMSVDWDSVVGVQKAIEAVTGKPFGDFYEEFAQAYWLRTFAPVNGWTFLENLTGGAYEQNAILRVAINQPLSTVLNRGNLPQISSGLLKIYAADPLPASFSRETGSTTGSIARIANTCTGNIFYFFDQNLKALPNLKFIGATLPGEDELLYEKNLGNLTLGAPLYLLYIDRGYNFATDCSPVMTLEQPTITNLNPNSVPKNRTLSITIYGSGFGPNKGAVSVAYALLPDAKVTAWTPDYITFTWDTGNTPGTVTVQVYVKKSARSNGMTLTITQ